MLRQSLKKPSPNSNAAGKAQDSAGLKHPQVRRGMCGRYSGHTVALGTHCRLSPGEPSPASEPRCDPNSQKAVCESWSGTHRASPQEGRAGTSFVIRS